MFATRVVIIINSKDYWLKREQENLKIYITEEAEYQKELQRIYQEMLDACQKDIESFYAKYASAEGISIAEAKKRVAKHDVKAFERTAARYVKEKNFSKRANEELRLYNATMKINRLEMLKANIGLETIAGHDKLEKFMAKILRGRTEDELRRQAGILGKSVKNNAKNAEAIVNGSFRVAKVGDRSTFSDRIWQYQDLMRQDLGRLLQQGLIQGKNARALTKDLRKYLVGDKQGKGATYNVERLMRTELARVQTEAQKLSYKENGVDYYIFIANKNPSKHSTCEICKKLDSKEKFAVADMMPGTNAPPVHPNCRCSTGPYVDRKELDEILTYVENGGTYEDWKKQNGKVNITKKGAIKHGAGKAIFESEKQYGVRYDEAAKEVDFDYINSEEYRSLYNNVTDNPNTNQALYDIAKAMLEHRNGTDYEDLYLLGPDGSIIASITDSTIKSGVAYTDEFIKALEESIKNGIQTIAIHNHPEGRPPSTDDFRKAYDNKYSIGLVVGHNGQVYLYSNSSFAMTPEQAAEIWDEVKYFYSMGYDIDNAAKLVYDGYGLEYTILKGEE